jgi:hypothetical protein
MERNRIHHADDRAHEPLSVIAAQREVIAQQQAQIAGLRALADSRAADLAVSQEIARRALDQLAATTQPTSHDTTKAVTLRIVKAA